jgi:hypothetical protein
MNDARESEKTQKLLREAYRMLGPANGAGLGIVVASFDKIEARSILAQGIAIIFLAGVFSAIWAGIADLRLTRWPNGLNKKSDFNGLFRWTEFTGIFFLVGALFAVAEFIAHMNGLKL